MFWIGFDCFNGKCVNTCYIKWGKKIIKPHWTVWICAINFFLVPSILLSCLYTLFLSSTLCTWTWEMWNWLQITAICWEWGQWPLECFFFLAWFLYYLKVFFWERLLLLVSGFFFLIDLKNMLGDPLAWFFATFSVSFGPATSFLNLIVESIIFP